MPLLKKLLFGMGTLVAVMAVVTFVTTKPVVSLVVVVAVVAFVASRPKPAPFHVPVPPMEMKIGGYDIFLAFHFIMSILPEKTRKKYLVKKFAPKPNEQMDRYDCAKEDPYTILEVVPEKMWQVKYDTGMSVFMDKTRRERAKGLGFDPKDPSFTSKVLAGAEQYGKKAVEVARQDIQKAVEVWAKESFTVEELLQLSIFKLNSFIIKLKSGSLLLYAPIKVREETGFAEWLDTLGKVDWIVMASGSHTLNLQPVVARYPDAKIIGPPQAEAKLNHISALPRGKVDYDSTNPAELRAANSSLEAEGVKLYNIAGDVVNALVAVYEGKQLMSCDLVYSHADGGFLSVDKDKFYQFLPEDWFARLFRYKNLAKPNSPNGFLPGYRFQLMDPNSLGVLAYDVPAFDGSDCKTMANSLRELVKAPFEFANGVHFEQMVRDAFIDAIDKNWNWLDGQALKA